MNTEKEFPITVASTTSTSFILLKEKRRKSEAICNMHKIVNENYTICSQLLKFIR
jgi:hypothetical protein